jgi:hypothetical protein
MRNAEERVSVTFLDLMHDHGGRHVKRLRPVVGPLVCKINRLPGVTWRRRYTRQMGSSYKGRHFEARYSRQGGARLAGFRSAEALRLGGAWQAKGRRV